MRKIGVVTTSRADYGLYLPILRKMANYPGLSLLLFVSGTHLLTDFGYTVEAIEAGGFPIAARIEMIETSDTPEGIAKSMGFVTQGFARAYAAHLPDILLVLGDRYEMHAAAVAAIPFRIPIAHIHGGELTYGAMDELFRHSLTKISHLHFASTEVYARRIIQMGEEPWRVVVSGAPGLDNIVSMPLMSRESLEQRFGLDPSKPLILTTLHPTTQEGENTRQHIENLLNALSAFHDFQILFTAPNADTNSSIIRTYIELFVARCPDARFIVNLGTQAYFSIMAMAAVLVGNSSSGIIEAAFFQLPVVNVGTRQSGRIRGDNVIDSDYSAAEIISAMKKALSPKFKDSLQNLKNPYGDGQATERILSVLARTPLENLLCKQFYEPP